MPHIYVVSPYLIDIYTRSTELYVFTFLGRLLNQPLYLLIFTFSLVKIWE